MKEKGAAPHYIHRRPLTPEEIRRIIFLRFSEGISVEQIASRFGCSKTKIVVALSNYNENGEHNPGAVQPADGRKRGRAFRIAEAS